MLLGIGIGLSISGGGQKPPPPNTLVASRGVFFLNGDALAPAYSFGCDAGSFGLTGVAAAFAQGIVQVLTAAAGAFALTGIAANLSNAPLIPAGTGVFTETGIPAAFNISMPASKGSFTLTGVAASLSTSGSDAAETTAFLARANAVTTLDTTHTNAYKALINGLVSDGIFSKLDILFIFATQSQGVALLNLVNSTYSASVSSGPLFTPDNGFAGDGTSASFIPTNYNPSTAGGNFTQGGCHISAWNTAAQSGDAVPIIGGGGTANLGSLELYPTFADDNMYMTVLDNPSSFASGLVDKTGWFCGTRTALSGANTGAAYINGSQIGANRNSTALSIPNAVLNALGDPSLASGFQYTHWSAAQMSAGGALSSTDAANYYSRLRTFMTAVGVP